MISPLVNGQNRGKSAKTKGKITKLKKNKGKTTVALHSRVRSPKKLIFNVMRLLIVKAIQTWGKFKLS